MPSRYLPDYDLTLEFPEGSTDADITGYIQDNYPRKNRLKLGDMDLDPTPFIKQLFAPETNESMQEVDKVRAPQFEKPANWSDDEEKEFKGWYENWAEETGIDPNPDDPQHFYDYRAAFRADAIPTVDNRGEYHWPSEFKHPDHPNRYVEGVDTITGLPEPTGPITFGQVEQLSDYVSEQERGDTIVEPKPEGWVAQRIRDYKDYLAKLNDEDRAREAQEEMDKPAAERVADFFTRYANDFIAGALGVGTGLVASLEWLTESETMHELNELGKEFTKRFAPEDATYIDQLIMGAGSMATFFIPGFGIMGVAGKLGKGGQMAAQIAKWSGLATATVLESMTEAGHSYNDVIMQTRDKNKAEKTARMSFGLNMALIGLTNKLGIFGEHGRLARRAIASALMEGTQEGGQEIISAVAEDRPIDWKDVGVASSIGAILGPAVGVAGAVVERAIPGAKEEREQREQFEEGLKKYKTAMKEQKPEEAERVLKEMGAMFAEAPEEEAAKEAPPEEVTYTTFKSKRAAAEWGLKATPEELEDMRGIYEEVSAAAEGATEEGNIEEAMRLTNQAVMMREAIAAGEETERYEAMTKAVLEEKFAEKEAPKQQKLFKVKKPAAKIVPPTEGGKEPMTPEQFAEHAVELEKEGVAVGRGRFNKSFFVSAGKQTGTIYGPAKATDEEKTRTVKKIFGYKEVTEYYRTIGGVKYKVLNTPILPKTKKLRAQKIDNLVKDFASEAPWYENWGDFMRRWEGAVPKDQVPKAQKIQAILSGNASPQGAQTATGRVLRRLEDKGVIRGGKGKGISEVAAAKVNMIWKGEDTHIKSLEDFQDFYGPKIGAMMFSMLHPKTMEAGAAVIDRHIPRLWGYNVMWKGFNVSDAIRREITDDIVEAARRLDRSIPEVQAALWFATGAGHTGTATHFEEAIQAAPKKALGLAMFTATTAEPQSIVHFGRTQRFMVRGAQKPLPLTAAEKKELGNLRGKAAQVGIFRASISEEEQKRLALLTNREEGDKPHAWSKNSVLKRMENHTPLNPYVPLGHWYPAAQRRESFFEGQEPHLTMIYEDEIYDLDEDKLGYWEVAKQRAASDPLVKSNQRTLSDVLSNSITNVIYEAGGKAKDYRGFKLRTGSMDVVYTFDETPVEEGPSDVTVGISDNVNSAVQLPTDLDEVAEQSGLVAQNFMQWIRKQAVGEHVSIKAIQGTLANAADATMHNVEYGLQLSLRGPATAIRAILSRWGVARAQQGVLMMNDSKAANGVRIEFDLKEDDLAKISRGIRRSGLLNFNLVRTATGYRFSYFYPYSEAENEALRDQLDTLYKGFGKEGTLEDVPTHGEFVGDFVEGPEASQKNYRANIIKYYGKTKGEEIYEEAKLQGDRWAGEYAHYFENMVRQSGVKVAEEPEEYRDSTPVRHTEEEVFRDTSEPDVTIEDDAEQKARQRGKSYTEQFEWKDPNKPPDWVKNTPKAMQMPELVRVVELLLNGKLPRVAKIIDKNVKTRGMFAPGAREDPLVTKADIYKDPALALKVLSHEIGHVVHWLPDGLKKGNILGHIASLSNYMKKTLPHHPGAPGELTEVDRRRLRLEAQKLLEAKNRPKLIDEMITKELPITPEDVLNIWNTVMDIRKVSPELYNYIAQLSTSSKKLIIKAALKGQVPKKIQRFAKKIQVPTGKKIEVLEEIKDEDITKEFAKLIEEEVKKRKLWLEHEVTEELMAHSQKWRPFKPAADPMYTMYRLKPQELFADALSALLVDPQYLRQNCPKFYEAFFSWMESNPKVERVYNEIQWQIHSGTVDRERTRLTFKMFDDGNNKYSDQLKNAQPDENFWEGLKRDFFDSFHFIIRDVRKLGEDEIPAADNPRYAIEKMVYSGSEVEGLVTMLANRVLKPLKQANLEWDREFGLMTFLRRVAVERAALANPRGWDAKTALEKIKSMQTEELHPIQVQKLEEAIKNFRNIHEHYFLKKAREANIYPEDLMKHMEDNEFYVTFNDPEWFNGRYGRAAGTRVHQQIGTLGNIVNPATATIMKDVAFIKAVNRNQAIKSVVKFYIENQHLLPNVTIEPCTKKNGGLRFNGKFMEIQEPGASKIENAHKKGLLVFLEGGKAYGYYINKDIAESFESNPVHARAATKLFRLLAHPFRMVFTELNYGFWLFNAFFRDLQRAMMSLPKGASLGFIKRYAQSIKPAFRSVFGVPDDVIKEMQDGNMLISIADMRGLLEEDKQVERLLKMYNMKPGKFETKIAGPFGQLFNYIGNIAKVGEYYFAGTGRALERTTKVASYQYLKDKFPDMPQEAVAHIVRTRGGSPDFLRTGRAHGIYNNILLFSNAMKEGYRGDIVAMKENPTAWWTKKFTFMLLPKALMLGALAGLLGDDIKEIMNGVSEYDLTNYLVIPLGLTASGKSVYFRVPTDETSRLVGGIVWKMFRAPEFGLWDGALSLTDYGVGQMPTLNPAYSVFADVLEYASGKNPYDNFRGRHAIPEQVFEAHDARSHKAFLKYIAGQVGLSIIHRFKYDDVDQVAEELEQVLGFPVKSTVGDWMVRLPDEPVASNALGRFLKVTNYGIKEKLRRGREKIQRKNARLILDAKEAAHMLVNGEALEAKHIQALALKPDVVDRNVLIGFARRHSFVYLEEYMAARTKEEKWFVLQKMIAANAMSPATVAPPGARKEALQTGGQIPTEYFKFEEE